MENQLNLVQKLAKIRAISDAVSKDKRGYNYKYADITSILAKVTAGMKKYNVSLMPGIVPGTADVQQSTIVNTKFDKTGKPYEQTSTEMLVKADMVFKWVNDDDPNDYIDVPWVVTGSQSDPSQALGSGLTYCTRYFLCNFFQIAQPETDVDEYRSKQKEAEKSEDKAIAEDIIGEFDKVVRQFLSDNPDQSDEVKKFISKYAKGGNYFAIKEPALASNLLSSFNEKFIKK
jgi:hypothetical protein